MAAASVMLDERTPCSMQPLALQVGTSTMAAASVMLDERTPCSMELPALGLDGTQRGMAAAKEERVIRRGGCPLAASCGGADACAGLGVGEVQDAKPQRQQEESVTSVAFSI
mmetsp:Transcript_67560/g.156829  ORF Transcript_67560/g.156829 Transcript_67560/m.156829 type:complete len:112 (-) Transcript_67560:66-401(-)